MRTEYVVVRVSNDGAPEFFNFEMMNLPQAEEIAVSMAKLLKRDYGVVNLNTYLDCMERYK